MTTIAYDHENKQIAVDGRTTTGQIIATDKAIKWIERDGDYWFLCGSVCDREKFVDHFLDESPQKPDQEIECSGIAVRNGEVYYCVIDNDGAPRATKIDYSDAMGSGYAFALAAMDHGKTAREAVKYASTRDSATGGRIRVFDVNKMKFVKS